MLNVDTSKSRSDPRRVILKVSYVSTRDDPESSWIMGKEFEDTKGVIRIRISKKNRQRKSTKGQTTIYKTYTHKTKDRVTRTPL
jgi:hypothetical protein